MDLPLSYKFGVSVCIQLFILGLASSPHRKDNDGLDQEAGVLRKYIKNGLRVAGRNAGVLNQGFPYDGVFWRFIRKLIEREKTGQTPIKKFVPWRETKRAEVAVTERIEELEEALKTVQSIQEEINIDSSGVKDGLSKEDELYNDLVKWCEKEGLMFSKGSPEQASYFVQNLCNALWYITNHQTTIDDAASRIKNYVM